MSMGDKVTPYFGAPSGRGMKNVLFYKGEFQSPVGTIDDLHTWKGQYQILEMNHEYIQWLFPNYFDSQFNRNSQALIPEEAQAFRQDIAIARNYIKSYELFLDFLGLRLKDRFTGQVERAAGGKRRLHAALVQNPHNQLRVRRILASMAVTGFSRYMEPLVQRLYKEAFDNGGSWSEPTLAELQNAPILEQLDGYRLGSALFKANTRAGELDMEESVFFSGKPVQPPAPSLSQTKTHGMHGSIGTSRFGPESTGSQTETYGVPSRSGNSHFGQPSPLNQTEAHGAPRRNGGSYCGQPSPNNQTGTHGVPGRSGGSHFGQRSPLNQTEAHGVRRSDLGPAWSRTGRSQSQPRGPSRF
mmetsp:Transcript_98708/g.120857  ORF Transcript_98708/g.120857 Transcript_98708/m.120857 type:complete len:356 (-) Transcript_98708:170-1237(-)